MCGTPPDTYPCPPDPPKGGFSRSGEAREDYRVSLEAYREKMETSRQQGASDLGDYRAGISEYRKGIEKYKEASSRPDDM
jgi:hypothetical protein